MPKIRYLDIKFTPPKALLIEQANRIIAEYAAQGFELTLRQLYYQFVARGVIPNTQNDYKNLGTLISDARLAGLIDWESIVDRTRGVRALQHWERPGDMVGAAASQFNLDRWRDQPYRPEVWIEKDALVGIFERVCNELDVPLFSCRGYTSQSEMWVAAQRLLAYQGQDQKPVIFHFGDHDPSGQDMSRDIRDRLKLFTGGKFYFKRLALNMDQVEQYSPPPNPTKISDSRAEAYIAEYGNESWELDALEPTVLADLARTAILGIADKGKLSDTMDRQAECRKQLSLIADRYPDVVEYVTEGGDR